MTIWEGKELIEKGLILYHKRYIPGIFRVFDSGGIKIQAKDIDNWYGIKASPDLFFSDEWELVREYMDIIEAFKAVRNGHNVKCEETGYRLFPKIETIHLSNQEFNSKHWYIVDKTAL